MLRTLLDGLALLGAILLVLGLLAWADILSWLLGVS